MTDAPVPPSATSCRNCGATAAGNYCPNCGQETSLALPTARAFLREAAGRYVALDGRLWRTMAALLFRPGYLANEYFAGRRRRYVRPGRLFLVLSIALFALLRFEAKAPQILESDLSAADRAEFSREINEGGQSGFSLDEDLNVHLDGGTQLDAFSSPWLAPLRERAQLFNRLPRQEKADQVFAGVMRYGPYAMFALLPLFALLLKLVYLGRARRYPLRPRRYAAHLLFGAYSHSFLFLVVALLVLLPQGLFRGVVILWAIVYLLRSMKNVYGGRWSGVLARGFVIFIAYSVFYGLAVAALVIAAILPR